MTISSSDFLTMQYSSAVQQLLDQLAVPALDPGSARSDCLAQLEALNHEQICDGPVANEEAAGCCLSGLWLAFNFLDRSHEISQSLPGQSGSYWHGIMHRREPDYSNSAYWFRKTGSHPLFQALPAAVAETVSDASPAAQALGKKWDPFAFNDLCEQNLHDGPERGLCEALQLIEWCMLFDFCLAEARS